MLHVYAVRFDVTENLKNLQNFLELVQLKNQKVFKILRHIESYGTCIKY